MSENEFDPYLGKWKSQHTEPVGGQRSIAVLNSHTCPFCAIRLEENRAAAQRFLEAVGHRRWTL